MRSSYPLITLISLLFKSYLCQSIQPTDYSAGVSTPYTLSIFEFSQTITAGSTILIEFPPQYSAIDLKATAPFTLDQSNSQCPDDCSTAVVSYSGMVITISNLYTTDAPLFLILEIDNIPNPPVAMSTGSFKLYVFDNLGQQVSQKQLNTIVFVPNTIPCSAAVNSFPIVNSITSASFTIQPQTNPSQYPLAKIELTFPQQWQDQDFIEDTKTSSLYCTSSSQPSLYCSHSGVTITVFNVQYANTIQFNIHDIYAPSMVINAGDIEIYTMTENSQTIETCAISVNGFEEDTFRNSSVTITYPNQQYLTVTIQTGFPKQATGSVAIYVRMPVEMSLASSAISVFRDGTFLSSNPFTYDPVTNQIRIKPFISLFNKPIITVSCTNVNRPRSAFFLSNITVHAYKEINSIEYSMATIECCQQQLQPRSQLDASLSVSDPQLLKTGVTYTFTITISQYVSMQTTDMIYIHFPYQYEIPVGIVPCVINTSPSDPTAISASPTCSASAIGTSTSTTLVKISSFLQNPQPIGSSTTFLVQISSITNPSSNPSAQTFTISLLTSSEQIIETINSISLTLNPAQISTFVITPSSFRVYQKDVTYTFQIPISGDLRVGYEIQISVPVQIIVYSPSLLCEISYDNGGSAVTNACPCYFRSIDNTVILRIEDEVPVVGSPITVIIEGLTNPTSFEPTTNFDIEIMNQIGNILQQLDQSSSSTLNVAMTIESQFSYCSLSMDPIAIIGQYGTLNILCISPFPISTAHTLQIHYDSTVMLVNQPAQPSSCSSPTVCTFHTDTSIQVTSNPVATDGYQLIQFSVTNCLILGPISSSSPFEIILKSPSNYQSLKWDITNIQNTSPQTIEYTVTQSSWVMGESSVTLTIDFTIDMVESPITQLQIHIPSQYTTPYSSNIYTQNSIPTIQSGQIIISSLTNPSTSYGFSKQYFIILGYDASASLIALSMHTLSRFQVVCQLPCQTCSNSDPSDCLTCYDPSIQPLYTKLYTDPDTSKGSCLDHCPQQYYHDTASGNCLPCDSNCLTCAEDESDHCLTCPNNHYLHDYVDHKCYGSCPSGFYASSAFHCRPCASNCETCTSLSTCVSCSPTYYLHVGYGVCLSQCPPKTYMLINPFRCVDCIDSNCVNCNQINCLACESPYYLYNGQCRVTCPSPLLPNRNGGCSSCECRQCSINTWSCTSCYASAPYLYNQKCYVECPPATYADSSSNCVACPGGCLQCSSPSFCSKCDEGLFLQSDQSICIASCSVGYITTLNEVTNISSCEACASGCRQCNISVEFCIECSDGYFLHENTCVQICPSPLHALDAQCKSCISTCQSCQVIDPYNCTECSPNYFLKDNNCYSACPSGTYADVYAKQCMPCNSLCRTCANATNCTSCIDDYYLFNWFCFDSCPTIPTFYYQYNGLCTACMPQCVSCIDSPVQCTACSHPDYIYNEFTFECSFTCIQPYFYNGSNCVLCSNLCQTCDETYDKCASCTDGLYLYNGSCQSYCPSGYFANSSDNTCNKCDYPCKQCILGQCSSCQTFAYIYKETCVISCPSDRPFEERGYCTDCVGVGFCAVCSKQEHTSAEVCSQCVYPYVLFDGNCLNECPENYTLDQISRPSGGFIRTCQISQGYLKYLDELKEFNRPILPPGCFIGIFLLTALLLFIISSKMYPYTYNTGYLLSLLLIIDSLFIYYCLYFIHTRYLGEYYPLHPQLPFFLIIASLAINNMIFTLLYMFVVLKGIYLKDARYQQWKSTSPNPIYWWVFMFMMPILGGHRIHKLNYSKLFGKDIFSFRITSVSKFYQEDTLTLLTIIGDMLFISALAICVFNVFITYNGLLIIGYQGFVIKILVWLFIFYDLKKPDRGFFKGDEAEAEEQILKQQEEEERKLQRVDTNDLAKLIRTKSAGQLHIKRLYEELDVDDFRSVYNPQDYEDVPIVPNKKIQKNIYKGKFKKGRKITIQQKLQKYIDNIKPLKTTKKKVQAYLKDLIYWKPPTKMKVAPKIVPQSEESMLALLNQKQLEYKDELEEVEHMEQERKLGYYVRPRYNQHNFLDDVDETIPNETVEFFYPSHSIETNNRKDSIDFDDLMNVNYARKKHLIKEKKEDGYKQREDSMRVLHHEPQKKRRNPLRGYGQMVMKKF